MDSSSSLENPLEPRCPVFSAVVQVWLGVLDRNPNKTQLWLTKKKVGHHWSCLMFWIYLQRLFGAGGS